MSGKGRFTPILVLVLVLVVLAINFIFPSMAVGERQLTPRVYLPNLDKNYRNVPPPPPSIAIDYVPPFYVVPYGDPVGEGRGRILNADLKKTPYLLIYIWRNQDDGWQKRNTGGGCGSLPPPSESLSINYADGSFSFGGFARWATEIQLIRFYLVDLAYCMPRMTRNATLPPEPPTEQVWAMTEAIRIYPDAWKYGAQLP